MNYEEKYKSALKWMQSLYGGLHGATKEEAEKYFPELKESEDERTRKELIDFLKLPHSRFVGNREHEKWIAWLEKQSDRDECDRILAWLEKQGEQNFDYEHADIPQKDFAPIEPKALDADKVVEWLECKAFQGWAEEINIKQIVDKFKKDFGL